MLKHLLQDLLNGRCDNKISNLCCQFLLILTLSNFNDRINLLFDFCFEYFFDKHTIPLKDIPTIHVLIRSIQE